MIDLEDVFKGYEVFLDDRIPSEVHLDEEDKILYLNPNLPHDLAVIKEAYMIIKEDPRYKDTEIYKSIKNFNNHTLEIVTSNYLQVKDLRKNLDNFYDKNIKNKDLNYNGLTWKK